MLERYPATGRGLPLAVVSLAVMTLVAALLVGAAPAAAGIGDRLPLEGLHGERLEASDLEQGVSLLVVWTSWSPRCRDIGSRINQLAETWSQRAEVGSVVFQENPEQIQEFLAGERLEAPVYFDRSGKFSKQVAVTTLPMLLIFKDSQLIFRGKLSANPDPVIERALASASEDARSGLE